MALNIQSSTLSLTLPISCQICLGKVRQPVICDNHHVFCSSCMEMWLKKASQCPTCRVPITAENPYREIIGGTNEGDHSDTPTMRKCLRKTRGELLLREYEEEIEGLMKENEELTNKNQSLEAQLRTALDPCSMSTSAESNDKSVPAVVLEEWTNKLRAATDACDKVKQDMDKMKETNKALRSQNVDLVRENMRLKAEVVSRSPHKFGRFTVAALEAKIQQYERDVSQLRKALEHSDQYIDDLESRIKKSDKKCLEAKEVCGKIQSAAEMLSQQQKISMMMRSLSDNERELICSNPEAECSSFARNPSAASISSPDPKDFNKNVSEDLKQDNSDGSSSDFLPSTPSAAFRSLTLRSPGLREKKVAFKSGSHQRKLDFDITPEKNWPVSKAENPFPCFQKFPTNFPANFVEWSSLALWGRTQKPIFIDPSCPGASWQGLRIRVSPDLKEEDLETKMSSEASMNAAYQNKVSELASMMLEGEGSLGTGSLLSLTVSPPADSENTPLPEAQTCPDVLHNVGEQLVQYTPKNQTSCDIVDGILNIDSSPKISAQEGFAALVSGRNTTPHGGGRTGSPQPDDMSFDLLFDPLEENKAAPSASLSSANQDYGHTVPASSSSSWTSADPVNTRERNVKRKSYSPFSAGSPTKLSKLM